MKKLALGGALRALAIPGTALAQDDAPTAKQSASEACKTERSTVGAETFRNTYGTNKNKSNAFGKCVSKRAKEAKAAEKQAKTTCKEERAADREAFEEQYGTNKNKKNAYGKCVSAQQEKTMEEETEDNVSAAKACRAERSDKGAEAFAAKYGTNKNKSNAFGKCVSRTEKAQDGEDDES